MTETEAIEIGKSLYGNITGDETNIIPTNKYIEFIRMSIQVLEEIRKIRELGECYIIPKNGVWEVNGTNIHAVLEEINSGCYEQKIRNQAIAEFAERLKSDTMTKSFGLRSCDIDRIAEEMKKGE